jgi:phytol kinase
MLLEAVAWKGLDNLFIPLGGFMLLRSFRQLDAATLGGFLLVALLLVVFALVWRRRTTLNDSAVLGAALIAFVAWAVGGWRWLIPPVTLFSLYAVLFPRANADGTSRTHDVYDVLRATGVGMLWLFAASTLERPAYLLPYTVSFAAQLAIIGVIRYGCHFGDARGKGRIATVVLKSLAVLLIPFVALEYVAGATFPRPLLWGALLFCAPVGVFLGVAGERLGAGNGALSRLGRRRWLRQAGVFIGSALPLVVLALGKASG